MTRLFHAGGAAAGSTIFPGLHGGMEMLRDMLKGSFKLDINRVSAALTIFSFGAAAIRYGFVLTQNCMHWIQQLFTACVTITAPDELHEQVLLWLSDNVIKHQKTRLLSARSVHVRQDGPTLPPTPQGARVRKRASSIQYLPAYGTTWFVHNRNLFAITRSSKRNGAPPSLGLNLGYSGMVVNTSSDKEELVSIMCLGRSPDPIKKFLDECRIFSRKLKRFTVNVRSCGERGAGWTLACQKAVRPLDTLYLDDSVKRDIVGDIRRYLNPATADYYTRRGIPYRRGYLLHGPPGTGKTSLSLALAGEFKLDLYVINMANVTGDANLGHLFNSLPARCIVLLEDIDAVGIRRCAGSADREDASSVSTKGRAWDLPAPSGGGCTLSGLLNVLDGVASQEGRIVLMTSNDPDRLDEALLRPGRVDRRYYLGCMKRPAVAAMFRRMFEPEPVLAGDQKQDSKESAACLSLNNETATAELLERQALEFAALVPEGRFTPAEMQCYLLMHRDSTSAAIENAPAWVDEKTGSLGEQDETQRKKVRPRPPLPPVRKRLAVRSRRARRMQGRSNRAN